MLIYQTTNPCLCNPVSQTTTPDCPEDCNCLKLCHITLNSSDSSAVGPCAAIGTLDVTDESYGHDTCACGTNPLRWSLEYFDPNIFVTASVTTAGVISYTTQGPSALDQEYGKIILKLCCGQISHYLEVLIGIKDLCNCPSCDACDDCDPCSGVCAEAEVDITVQGVDNSGTTNVS